MSLWQRPHDSESRKKLDGITAPVFVVEDEGKNGDFGPCASSSIDTGTTMGFRISLFEPRARFAPATARAITATAAIAARSRGTGTSHRAIAAAMNPAAVWQTRAQRCGVVLPPTARNMPASAVAANMIAN